MNVIAPPSGTAVREIPLDRLFPAPGNVRRTPPGAQADAELKASIAALGLLENLVVREDGDGRHAVIAGGRRLKALQALAEDGTIDPDRPVPCQVLPGEVDAEEISLAENVVRIAMHPADQVVAFTKLAEAGQTVASIAARFGAAERTVEQRLRLGGVAPDLLHALRAGEIDLEILKAFAVTTDRARQMAVWDQVSAQGHPPSAWQVRRLLTEERVPGTSALARFVGAEAYEAAGGAVIRDLFAQDDETGTWFEDPALLERLAGERLKAAADELATRWKWAAAMTEVSWQDTARYGRVHPEPSDPTDEEAAEVERLEARQEELCNLDDADWTEELDAEAGAVESRLDEIGRAILARAAYSREDMALAGCIVTVGHDGAMEVVQGLVRPEDMPETTETDGDDATAAASGNGVHPLRIAGPVVASDLPKDREADARRQAGIGIGLADDLRAIRTALVKAHLAGSFAAAFDLALFQLARSVFRPGFTADALDITVRESADRPATRMNDADFADWSPGEAMLEDRSGLALDWMEIEDEGESFAALRALRDPDKRALFAACVARTVRPQLAFEPQARPELEATVARLGIDFAAHVRPTADMLWSRIPKGRMLEIARETLGVEWADARAKLKKPELADAMEAAFAAGERPVGMDAGAHAAAVAWTPPGFAAFDAGRIDTGAEPRPDGDAAEAEPGADTDGAGSGDDANKADPAIDAGAAGAGETEATEPESGAAAPEGGATNGAGPDAGTDPQDGDGEADPVLATVKAVVANAVARARPADALRPGADAQDGADADAVPANGHDPSAEPAEIPAFLRNAG